jgi:outer membrane lipoprotein-sorting protein
MNIQRNNAGTRAAGFALLAALAVVAPQGLRAQQGPGGQQAPPGPTGPLAPEKYKNIQVLTNVSADQLDTTMRYVSASVGMRCSDCHVVEPGAPAAFEKDDKRAKQTARQMMKMVYAINAGGFGVQVECGTCHAGQNRPAGMPMAAMLTPEQVAQMTPPSPPPGAGLQGPQGAAGASGGGRGPGRGAPGPPVADVVDKYLAAIGGRAAAEKMQSLSMNGTVTSRTGLSVAFTIEEKPNKYRESRQTTPNAMIHGFDGKAGWQRTANTGDLTGFQLDQALRLSDLGLVLHLNDKYTNVQSSGRPMQVEGKDTTVVSGRVGPATEQFFFDSSSGLLLRRVVATRTTLGTMREQIDYADYRSVGDLKLPFEMKLTTWNTLDTFKVADAKVNVALDDARFSKPN